MNRGRTDFDCTGRKCAEPVSHPAQRLEIEIDPHGAVIGADGLASPVLHAIGPLTRGRDREMSAVPELRVQAEAMAQRLSATVPVPPIFG